MTKTIIKNNNALERLLKSINQRYTKPGAILKGIRLREGLTQTQFAAMIQVKQGDLSKMESGMAGNPYTARSFYTFNVLAF